MYYGRSMRIAIVGGGLGGLAAALFLLEAGLDVTVYEQTPEAREVGAGIVVSPNMVRPLRQLGLLEKLCSVAVRLEAAHFRRRGPQYPCRTARRALESHSQHDCMTAVAECRTDRDSI